MSTEIKQAVTDDQDFLAACEASGTPPTRKQLAKWNRKDGAARQWHEVERTRKEREAAEAKERAKREHRATLRAKRRGRATTKQTREETLKQRSLKARGERLEKSRERRVIERVEDERKKHERLEAVQIGMEDYVAELREAMEEAANDNNGDPMEASP